MSNLIIHNIRFGFATNSSSTHSVVYNKDYSSFSDNNEEDYFGWDNFTLQSKNAKKEYIMAMLMINLNQQFDILPEDVRKLIVDEWSENNSEIDIHSGIDHQSTILFPLEYGTEFLSKDFYKDYEQFLLQDGIIICGGNDNEESSHPIIDNTNSKIIQFPLYDNLEDKLYCRFDDKYNFWTMFNSSNGNKVRFSFSDTKIVQKIEKASTPELVDIKITDFCSFGCSFCYQDSSISGKHSNSDDFYKLIRVLNENKVFEVAIGGGEPTQHPNFISMLKNVKYYKIVANFTTKSLDWLRDKEQRDEILSNIGSFAYSVTTESQVKTLGELCNQFHMFGVIPTIHVVIGVVNDYMFAKILKTAHFYGFKVTLLGFKTTGRGSEFLKNKKIDHSGWIKEVKELVNQRQCPSIGIDTCLIQLCEEELKKNKIPKYVYTVYEGKFSCYIDAVNLTMGPSSFCQPEEMKPLDMGNLSEEFKENYQEF